MSNFFTDQTIKVIITVQSQTKTMGHRSLIQKVENPKGHEKRRIGPYYIPIFLNEIYPKIIPYPFTSPVPLIRHQDTHVESKNYSETETLHFK